MKLSQVTRDQVAAMTEEQKWAFNCGGIRDDGRSAEVAILLGGAPIRAVERARWAVKLWHSGRVKYIVPSGGVAWDYEGERLTEELKKAIADGTVPQPDVVPEAAVDNYEAPVKTEEAE